MVNKRNKINKGSRINKASIKNTLCSVSSLFKRSSHSPALTLHNNFYSNPRYYKYFTLGIFAFLLAFISSAALIPIANSSAESTVGTLTEATGITITNTGNLALSVNNLTSSGQLVKTIDTVTVDATSAPNGYKLYLSTPTTATSNRLYLSGDTTSTSYISPNQTNSTDVALGSETTLADNSWGFTNSSTNNNNSKYSAVPLSSSPALIGSSNTATTQSQDVYYAVKANTSLPAGNYSGTVVYTALADTVEQVDTITSITPNYNVNQNSTQQVQIKVTFPVVIDSTSVLTNITTTIGGSTCTSPSYALSNDTSGNQKVLTITCTAPTQSTAGAKDIVVSAEKGSFKYTFQSGTSDTSKKYYYNSTRGLTLSPSSYEGNESTTTSVTANFPAPVSSLGTTTAKLGSTTLSCTSINTTTNTTYTTLTMTCTIPEQTATSTQALTVTSTAFSSYTPSADFTYTYVTPIEKMQDFTTAKCEALTTTTSTADNRIILQDSRDQKEYKIAKLADGNCWMVQNLALDGTDSNGNVRTLTAADSDVTASRTLAANMTSGSSDSTSVQIVSSVADDTTSSCSFTYCVTSDEPYGNHYNWYAATATTGTSSMSNGDATDSICPKGWKLPTSGTSSAYGASAPDKSYGKLMYSVLGFSSGYVEASGGNYIKQAQQAPLWFSLAGYSYNSEQSSQRRSGSYWSRKAYSNDSAYYLNFDSYGSGFFWGFYPQSSNAKYFGLSVRCVFDPPATMQSFTASQCNSLATTTSTADNRITLSDSRDGKIYTVAKLEDGNCWMTQNLALDGGRTLSGGTGGSDLGLFNTTTVTLPDNISEGTSSNSNSIQISSDIATNSTTNCGSNYPNCVVSNEPYGNLYNWYAATATSGTSALVDGNAGYSICPYRWELPIAGSSSAYGSNSPNYSYSKLMYSTLGLSTQYAYNDTYVKKVQQAPLWFPLAGRYFGSFSLQGETGIYWTKQATSNSALSYALNFRSASGADFNPQQTANKSMGLPVRCVFVPSCVNNAMGSCGAAL